MFDGDPPPLANRVLLYNFIFFDSCYPYKFSLILRINKAKISAIEASEDLEFYITGFLRTAYRPYAYRLKILNTAYQKGGFTLRHVHVAHAFNTCIIETVPFCQESTVGRPVTRGGGAGGGGGEAPLARHFAPPPEKMRLTK